MRTQTHRLTCGFKEEPTNPQTELYHYTDGLIETENIAAKAPHVVTQLTSQLESTLALNLVKPSEVVNVSLGVKPTV